MMKSHLLNKKKNISKKIRKELTKKIFFNRIRDKEINWKY
jgi:hypothetical protein